MTAIAAQSAGAPEPPRSFDDFQVLRPLGRGGMGQVYLGHDLALDRPVALKFIAAANPSPEARSRFVVEARALARLAHPNIVGVYRIGEAAGRPYIAYEFIAGQSLDRLPLPLPWPEVLRIALGLARGLTAAHRVGILHRDIKPGNVMLSDAGEVKLLDFGLAKLGGEPAGAPSTSPPEGPEGPPDFTAITSEDLTVSLLLGQKDSVSPNALLTTPGAVLGTPLYLSPEQWLGEAATPRSDVYALGLVLFELLTGTLPFKGLERSALLRVVLSEGLPPVRSLRPELPEALARIVDRCVLRQAAGRFASAQEVGESLEEAQHALLTVAGAPPASLPRTQYTRSNGLSLAYQVVGAGPVDLVFMLGWVTHVELAWQHPSLAGFLQRLAGFSRVIHFDKRGTGLSDRTTEAATFEERMDDVRAVMDAAPSRRAVLLGISEGAGMCALFAALHPRRVRALVLYGGTPRALEAPGYPGFPPAFLDTALKEIHHRWGEPVFLEHEAPSMASDAGFRDWFARYLRMAASPGSAAALLRMNTDFDLRAMLHCIHVPTLVLHRAGDRLAPVGSARYMAEHIPGARFVELPGEDHLPFVGDTGALLDEVERFLGSTREVPEASRALGILLAARVPEEASDWLHREVTEALLARYGGERLPARGPGPVARFDGAARAIQAARELAARASAAGVRVSLGLHAGDCALEGDVSAEPAVLLAARIAASARPGEVLVSDPVRVLLGGTAHTFAPAVDLPPELAEVPVHAVSLPAGR
jgi:serine/threonine protein kinase/alpha-beta hydrolase superfamily lysophospholipase